MSSKFRSFFLFAFLLLGQASFSQEWILEINATARAERSDTMSVPLDSARMEVYLDSVLVVSDFSGVNGKFDPAQLPLDGMELYKVYFSKPGYVTKMCTINTFYAHPEDLMPTTFCNVEVTLFKTEEGLDFSYLTTEPLVKFSFNDEATLTYDRAYTQMLLTRIENTRKRQ